MRSTVYIVSSLDSSATRRRVGTHLPKMYASLFQDILATSTLTVAGRQRIFSSYACQSGAYTNPYRLNLERRKLVNLTLATIALI